MDTAGWSGGNEPPPHCLVNAVEPGDVAADDLQLDLIGQIHSIFGFQVVWQLEGHKIVKKKLLLTKLITHVIFYAHVCISRTDPIVSNVQ